MDIAETIQLANERVSILQAARMIGLEVGEYSSTSSKLYCPFGDVSHLDGGNEKSFRIYPETNSAYCFAEREYYSPVKLIALARDVPEVVAAESLLAETNYVAPNYLDQWDALISQKPVVNTADLAEALKVACSRMSKNWEELQFDDTVSAVLSRCLGLLSKVKTDVDAARWLETTKLAMSRTIGDRP